MQKKTGQWFDFHLYDEENSSIRVACYHDCSEQFESRIKEESHYEISGATVKRSTFNGVTNTEIVLNQKSIVKERLDIDIKHTIQFMKLIDVGNTTETTMSVIGIIKDISDEVSFANCSKKEVKIEDESAVITVIFWDQRDIEMKINDVIAIYGGKVNDFKGSRKINL